MSETKRIPCPKFCIHDGYECKHYVSYPDGSGAFCVRFQEEIARFYPYKGTLDTLLRRLATYPGAHKNEKWKLETDLSKCTDREKAALEHYGVTVRELMELGMNRGQVSHMLFGYRFSH